MIFPPCKKNKVIGTRFTIDGIDRVPGKLIVRQLRSARPPGKRDKLVEEISEMLSWILRRGCLKPTNVVFTSMAEFARITVIVLAGWRNGAGPRLCAPRRDAPVTEDFRESLAAPLPPRYDPKLTTPSSLSPLKEEQMSGDNARGRFVWYDLMTPDPEAAKAFYTAVAGWGTEAWENPGMSYTMWTAGGKPMGGTMKLPDEAVAGGARPHWIAYVDVPDVDAAAARARELGAP